MQFKYPELLWALFLLLIPILIHLFQLRRFKKTPFTNVKFLKKVVAESRRSNTLKKWLLLLTRLLLLAAFVFAFARPFFASTSALKKKETVIYLDDSFSMQLKKDGATLLEEAIQQLIQSIPKTERFSLFTNQKTFKDVVLDDIQNELLALPYANKQLKLSEIDLKGKTLLSEDDTTGKNLVVISDFQQSMGDSKTYATSSGIRTHIIQLSSDTPKNVVVDTAYLSAESADNMNLTVTLSSNVTMENIPVSLFNGDKLIAKTSATFNEGKKAKVNLSLPNNEVLKGKIAITDPGLNYDNQLYFNIDEKKKVNVLAIGPLDNGFLKRIYSENEFAFSTSTVKNLNYGDLASQNLIILNGLINIPNALSESLKAFTKGGGHLVVVPSTEIDLNSYNLLVSNYFSTSFVQSIAKESDVTDISFSHPLYRNVFEKNVTNFQYPKVSRYFTVKTTAPTALLFQDKNSFLIGADRFFLFTASLSSENSNFRNSPLIVPTFYNLGIGSLKLPQLYSILGNSITIDVPITLSKDNILKLSKMDYEFIPRQQSLANRVSIMLADDLLEDGIYTIKENERSIGNVSFNYDRNESNLSYLNIEQLQTASKEPSIASLFESMEKDNSVTELWKWFVILALLLLMVEILIQKFL